MTVQVRALDPLRTDADIASVGSHLQSTAAGSYLRNHCLIRLERDTSFWNTENEPTLHRLSVFVHEYLHFVHNFSTVSGLYDFFAQLRLLRIFCNTVGTAGKSLGMQVLEPESRREASSMMTWRRHLRGGLEHDALDALRRAKAHPPFAKYKPTTHSVHIGPQNIECHGVVVEFDGLANDDQAGRVEIALGSDVLMEGCALETECQLFEQCGGNAADVRSAVPPYPYLTARTIFEGITGWSPSSRFLSEICVLTLQSTDPGDAFIQIAEACKRAGHPADEKALVEQFLSNTDAFFQSAVKKVLETSLAWEVEPFVARGRAGKGLRKMVDWADALFKERLRDRLFELTAIRAAPNLEPLVDLLRAMPVCPVVQEVDTSTHENQLLFFSEDEPSPEFIEEIGAAQSLLHLASSHLTADGTVIPTSNVPSRPCLFVRACQAPLAMAGASSCLRAPWDSFFPTDTHGCWYAQGVMAARVRRDI